MNPKHERLLGGLEMLGGQARIDELSIATGLSNRDLNNSLRTIAPEYVKVIGRESRRGDGRDDPKVLSLTDAGRKIGEACRESIYDSKVTVGLHERVSRLNERVAAVEEANAQIVSENRKLKRLLFDAL